VASLALPHSPRRWTTFLLARSFPALLLPALGPPLALAPLLELGLAWPPVLLQPAALLPSWALAQEQVLYLL
jgi:hypothetical protein